MTEAITPSRYSTPMRVLHWLIAAMIISLLCVGIYMTGLEKQDEALKWKLYGLHKATGVMVIVLVLIRVVVRLKSAIPPLPSGIVKKERMAAEHTHRLLYFFMFCIPISGLWMSNTYGYGVNMYGLFKLEPIFPKNPDLGDTLGIVHEYGAYALIGIIVLHVAGALKHRFIDKNDVIYRMTWGKAPEGAE